MADIRALYCQMYKPADEIEPPVGCNIPGFTMEECEAGADFLVVDPSHGHAQPVLRQVLAWDGVHVAGVHVAAVRQP